MRIRSQSLQYQHQLSFRADDYAFAWGNTKKFYDTPEQVAEDIANGYKEFIKDVYAAGCRNLQFDDCSWGMVVDPSACKFFGTTPAGLEKD